MTERTTTNSGAIPTSGEKRPPRRSSRFTEALAEQLCELEDDLCRFGLRLGHVMSVQAELVRVGRGKPFVPHLPMWNMLVAEHHMIIVDLASWALGFYRKGKGGFLRKLGGPDLVTLARRTGNSGSAHQETAWRTAAFDRLFPGAGPHPCQQDIDGLGDRLDARFKALVDDRNDHRAHKYERRQKVTADALAPAEVAKHLEGCQQLLGDFRCLSSDIAFAHDTPRADPDDAQAQDVVDLILCGTIDWISEYGAGADPDPERRRYWQRRHAYYERLHVAHDALGDAGVAFNNHLRLLPEQTPTAAAVTKEGQ